MAILNIRRPAAQVEEPTPTEVTVTGGRGSTTIVLLNSNSWITELTGNGIASTFHPFVVCDTTGIMVTPQVAGGYPVPVGDDSGTYMIVPTTTSCTVTLSYSAGGAN